MDAARLSRALAEGAPRIDRMSRVAVFGARADDDLSALPRDRVAVIQGFYPDHAALAAAGWTVHVAPGDGYDAAVVCLPRSRAAAQALVAQALELTGDGPVVVDGRKDDGIDAMLRQVRARDGVEVGGPVSRAHGKLFWFHGGDFADWRAGDAPRHLPGGWVTRAGVFSADAPDRGSEHLAASLPVKLPGRVADLGAGWGYLARAVLDRAGVESLDLVEADHAALDCARANVTDPRARFHWADATRFGAAGSCDAVVMNPPFHEGRRADPGLGRAFIAAAARLLKPSGRLWMVANRHLPYERDLREAFAELREIGGDGAFKVIEAARPRRGRR